MTTKFIVVGETADGEKRREFDSRSDAENAKQDLEGLVENVRIETADGQEAPTSGPGTACKDCGGEIPADAPADAEKCEHHGAWALATSDGGEATVESESVADKMEAPPEATQADVGESVTDTVDTTQNGDGTNQTPATGESEPLAKLGEQLDTDPLDVLPGYMITHVDGKPSLNKRGVSVLAYHYGISVTNKATVAYPHETDFECAIVEITVEGKDGRVFVGAGEAHVDETPKHQLLRMAETRAYKRAVIFATGTGIVGYQELMGELQ